MSHRICLLIFVIVPSSEKLAEAVCSREQNALQDTEKTIQTLTDEAFGARSDADAAHELSVGGGGENAVD
jgi:hypothetical protein